MKQQTPSLQAPGAGLPFSQMAIMRLWFGPIVSKRAKLSDCRKKYELLTGKLIALASGLSVEARKTRVLIPPMKGLEDSSRYWSVHGVLEHLLIVSTSMEQAILSLASGTVPSAVADTAKVKPTHKDADILAEFSAVAPGFLAKLDEKLQRSGMNIKSSLRFKHPWFGPITAHQWYWLMSVHQGIHYQQAKQIVKGLAQTGG